MKNNIKIAFIGMYWIDVTNNNFIGNAKQLIDYVNTNNLKVANEDSFVNKSKFWYNQPIINLNNSQNYNLENLIKDSSMIYAILRENGVVVTNEIIKHLSRIYQDIQTLHEKMLQASIAEFLTIYIKETERKSDDLDKSLKNYYYDENLIYEAVSRIDISNSNHNIISDIVYEKKHILNSINVAIRELISIVQEDYPIYDENHDYHFDYHDHCLSCEIEQIQSEKDLQGLNFDYEKMCR